MNEMAVRFLTYEATIGEDMVYCRLCGYSGLCEFGDGDDRELVFSDTWAAGIRTTSTRLGRLRHPRVMSHRPVLKK